MESVPRIPMFVIPQKSSPVAPDISPIKKKIRKRYGDQVFINEDIFRSFLALRTGSCKFPTDESSLATIKRYYAHLLLLKKRIDLSTPKFVEWPWQDAFLQKQFLRTEFTYEEAATLYGLGSAYSILGRKETRFNADSLKAACTNFQCAAWVFQTLRERYGSFTSADDMTGDLFHIYSLILLNQAQECIVEKSIADGRSPKITAKLAKYLSDSYERCLTMINALNDSVPTRFRSDWSRMMSIKKFYYTALVDFFMASEEASEMRFGAAVAHFKLAQSSIEEAWRVAKGFTDAMEPQVGQGFIATIQFAREIIVNGCTGAIKDNSQIYHEIVPQAHDLEKVEGACLAKPSGFDHADPAVIGEDIFKDLLPIETLEASSLYSEMKAQFLRKILAEAEVNDEELNSFVSSLNLDPKDLLKPDSGLPQPLLDQCAKFNSMEKSPESQLSAQMSALVDVSVDVETDMEEISADIEKAQENLDGVIPISPSSKTKPIKERLNKVRDRYAKFARAAQEAKDLNKRLHEALTEQLKMLKTLTLPPDEIDALLPNANDLITDSELLEGLDEAARILEKVERMQAQRTRMLEDLRRALQADDVTQELLASPDKEQHSAIFQRHLDSHQEALKLLRLNLSAQTNITKALVATHARIGVKKHDILKRRRQRADEIDALIRSGEAYDDLLLKCDEGQRFYEVISERIRHLRADLEQINIAINGLQPKLATSQILMSSVQPTFMPPTSVPPEPKGAPTLREVLKARAGKKSNVGSVPPMAPSSVPPAGLMNPCWQPQQSMQSQQQQHQPMPPSKTVQPQQRPVTQPQQGAPTSVASAVTNEAVQPSTTLSFESNQLPIPQDGALQNPQRLAVTMAAPMPNLGYYYQSPSVAGIHYPIQPLSGPAPSGNQQSLPPRPLAHPQPQWGQWLQPRGQSPILTPQYRPGTPSAGLSQDPPIGQPQPTNGAQAPLIPQQPKQQYRTETPGSNQQPMTQQQMQYLPKNLPQNPVSGQQSQYQSHSPGHAQPHMTQQQSQCRPVSPVQGQSLCRPTPMTQQPVQYRPSNHPQDQPMMTQSQNSYRPAMPIQNQPPMHYRPQKPQYQPYGAQNPVMAYRAPTTSQPSMKQQYRQAQVPASGQPMLGQNANTTLTQLYRPQASIQNPAPLIQQQIQYRPSHAMETSGASQQQQPPYEGPYTQQGYGTPIPTMTQYRPPYQPYYSGYASQGYYGGQPYLYGQPQQPSQTAAKEEKPKPALAPARRGESPPLPVPKVAATAPEPVVILDAGEAKEPGVSEAQPVDKVVGDAPQNGEREPLAPQVLTQADLEVQRREKQLRATYDPTVLSFATPDVQPEVTTVTPTTPPINADPLSADPLALNRFIDSTERLLTWLKTMHESPEPRFPSRLEEAWSRTTEIASRGGAKRPTQAAARCASNKNRRQDCVAFDFNRVPMKTGSPKRDDYINASHLDFMSSLGEWCPQFILTQAPLPSTVADFWGMIFEQACELVVLALPPRRRTSLLPSSIDPSESYEEGAFGDPLDNLRVPPHLPSLKVGSRIQVGTGSSALELRMQAAKFTRPDGVSQQDQPSIVDSIAQSTCIERILTLRNCESQQTRTVVHLCYSGPIPNADDSNSITAFTAFVTSVIGFYKQQRSLMHPVAVVSEDGGGLGGVFVASMASILHAEVLGRLADVCELVGCLCQQRKGAFSQADQLAATKAVVGLAAKQVLARRDIVVGPSNKSHSRKLSETAEKSAPVAKPGKQDFTSSLFSSQPLQISEMMSALGFAPPLKPVEETKPPEVEKPKVGEEPEKNSSGKVFDDLPSHLVDLSLSDTGANGSPVQQRRHYQARDFIDREYKESRDKLNADPSVFGDLDPLRSSNGN